MAPKKNTESTRARLIEAAGRLFAERGFKGTSVREVCGRAKVNLSAVDYHFGGKEGLYREICAYVLERAREGTPLDGGLGTDADAQVRLLTFVQSYLARICNAERPSWEHHLIHREMMNPSDIGQEMIASTLRQEMDMLKEIIRKLMAERMADDRIELCVLSIIGQCHFHAHYRRFKAGGLQWPHLLTKSNAQIAEHIGRFSLAGILSADRLRVGSDLP
jgi:AcrR family transcriptional regulator